MAKKTRVTLPGSLSDLVKDLQNGGAGNVQPSNTQSDNVQIEESAPPKAEQKPVARPQTPQEQHEYQPEVQQPKPVANVNDKNFDKKDESVAEKPAADRGYNIVKDDTTDSWDLFLDLAKQYREGDGKLATIYIDSQLKNVLDRMKYAGPEKLSTSAILSSIVARFIYDHEDQIRKALFSGNLI